MSSELSDAHSTILKTRSLYFKKIIGSRKKKEKKKKIENGIIR